MWPWATNAFCQLQDKQQYFIKPTKPNVDYSISKHYFMNCGVQVCGVVCCAELLSSVCFMLSLLIVTRSECFLKEETEKKPDLKSQINSDAQNFNLNRKGKFDGVRLIINLLKN